MFVGNNCGWINWHWDWIILQNNFIYRIHTDIFLIVMIYYITLWDSIVFPKVSIESLSLLVHKMYVSSFQSKDIKNILIQCHHKNDKVLDNLFVILCFMRRSNNKIAVGSVSTELSLAESLLYYGYFPISFKKS